MRAFRPRLARESFPGSGVFERKVVFDTRRREDHDEIQIRCGQCAGCRLSRARDWAVRCMHEAQLHKANSFVTLTYAPDKLPENGSLRYRDFQLFMKRLRKSGRKARFLMCGEYGEQYGRPHYHACLFGVGFPDRVLLRRLPSGSDLYSSKELEGLWPHGFCSVGDVTFESAAYVARYVLKKQGDAVVRLGVLDTSTGELRARREEFLRMSLKPGVGARWYERFKGELVAHDGAVMAGHLVPVPAYYNKKFIDDPEVDSDGLQFARYKKSLALESDNSYARLRVQEEVALARVAFKKRGLE